MCSLPSSSITPHPNPSPSGRGTQGEGYFPIACCLLKLTSFNLSPRRYAQSFRSAGVSSFLNARARLYPIGLDLLMGIRGFYPSPALYPHRSCRLAPHDGARRQMPRRTFGAPFLLRRVCTRRVPNGREGCLLPFAGVLKHSISFLLIHSWHVCQITKSRFDYCFPRPARTEALRRASDGTWENWKRCYTFSK